MSRGKGSQATSANDTDVIHAAGREESQLPLLAGRTSAGDTLELAVKLVGRDAFAVGTILDHDASSRAEDGGDATR